MDQIKETNRETYNKIASHYNKTHSVHFWVDELPIFEKYLNKGLIVDLGCGAGRDTEILKQRGYDCVGVDISPGMLSEARDKVPDVMFREMDLSNLDFEDNTFDGFWASASLLHIPKNEVLKALVEFKRVIKEGGIGFISVKEKVEMDEGFIPEKRYDDMSRYFSFFEKDEIESYILNAGFSIIDSHIKVEDDERKTHWICIIVKK